MATERHKIEGKNIMKTLLHRGFGNSIWVDEKLARCLEFLRYLMCGVRSGPP
jgi:hypothetical protein